MMPSYYICEHLGGFAEGENFCPTCNLKMCDACAVAHKIHLPAEPIPTSSADFEVKKAMLIEEARQELVRYNRERAGIAEDRVKVLEAERDRWKLEAIRLRGIISNASAIIGGE